MTDPITTTPQSCYLCGSVAPDGGLRMTEAGDLICRYVIPCAAEISQRHLSRKGTNHDGTTLD